MSKILDEVAQFYNDHYECDGDRLVQLFGLREVLRMCKNCRLDEIFSEEYEELKNKLENGEG